MTLLKENAMRKAVAATLLATGITFAPVLDAVHAQEETVAEDDDDDGNWGLLGLIGLAGLAGLAGLKRRDVRSGTVAGYDGTRYTTTSDTGTTRP
jgi:MYXO-CTERM domain-containing protein